MIFGKSISAGSLLKGQLEPLYQSPFPSLLQPAENQKAGRVEKSDKSVRMVGYPNKNKIGGP